MDTGSTSSSPTSSSTPHEPGGSDRRTHHHGLLVAMAIVLVAASAHAQTGDVVILPSGERIVGDVVEHLPGRRVVIWATDGTTYTLGPGEFSSVTFEDPSRAPDRVNPVPSAGFAYDPTLPSTTMVEVPALEVPALELPASPVPPLGRAYLPTSPSTPTVDVPAPEVPASPVPSGRRAYVPTSSRYDPYDEAPPRHVAPGRRTRGNRIHILGIVLGALGVVGGAVLLLGGAISSAVCDGRSSGSSCGDGAFIAGAVTLPIGGLALITSFVALAVDRVPAEPTLRASVSPDGATLSLEVGF